MYNFKESLKVNSKRNIDEMLCTVLSNKMGILCNNLESKRNDNNKEKIDKEIEQVHDRIRKISKLFINFDRNMEYIAPNGSRRIIIYAEKKHNEVDEKIIEIVEETSSSIYNKMTEEKEKKQVLERMQVIMTLLENFDENMLRLQRIEMQQTKMGELIFAQNR